MSIKAAILALLALQQTQALQCHKYDGETPDGEISQKDRNTLVECEQCPLGHIEQSGICVVELDDGECQISADNCALDSDGEAKLATIRSFQACKCAECKTDYYYDENFNCVSPLSCENTVDNCAEQNHHTCVCYKCNDNFINDYGECKDPSEVCQEPLSSNCLRQDGECKCIACEVGFEVVEGLCAEKKVCETPLSEGCLQQDPDCFCIGCDPDYELVDGECNKLPVCEEPLPENCAQQTRECDCIGCVEGHRLEEDGECKPFTCEPIDGCADQALNCSCKGCEEGKVLHEGGCVDDEPGIIKCAEEGRCPPNSDIYLEGCKEQDCHTCRCVDGQCKEGYSQTIHLFCEQNDEE